VASGTAQSNRRKIGGHPLRRLGDYFRVQWQELGGIGRVALFGLVASLVVAALLGLSIPRSLEQGLLDAHLETFTRVADDLVDRGLIPRDGAMSDLDALDEAVMHQLIGADVARVKLWSRDGTIVYSDASEIMGRTFTISPRLEMALTGIPQAGHPDEATAESASEAGLGHLWEFYIPILDSSGDVRFVLEMYHRADELHSILDSTRVEVWVSIGSGLLLLLLFMLSFVAANFRNVDRRRRDAERLFADLSRAQEEERSRIVGALHDDIGQPLYSVLYGIEGSRAQVEASTPVAAELARVSELVRGLDRNLRSELRMLRQGDVEELDLDSLLSQLADDVRRESSLNVRFVAGQHQPLSVGIRGALFRAAREAVTNARRHSGATEIEILVSERGSRVVMDVQDNGRGIVGEVGLGLATTKSRLEAIGGGLEVARRKNGGTRFRAWAPVDRVSR
jgi:two-component system NarL family sensor kinase